MSLTELPLMVRNRQPDAEVDDPQVTEKLVDWFARVRDYLDQFTPIDDSHLPDPDTHLSRTQLLSLAIGFVGADTAESRDNRTFTLVYTDPDSGKSNYQTVCIPYYAPSSPIRLEHGADGTSAELVFKPTGEALAQSRWHARIFEASNHYYSRVSPAGDELPTAAITSPYSTCAGGAWAATVGRSRVSPRRRPTTSSSTSPTSRGISTPGVGTAANSRASTSPPAASRPRTTS